MTLSKTILNSLNEYGEYQTDTASIKKNFQNKHTANITNTLQNRLQQNKSNYEFKKKDKDDAKAGTKVAAGGLLGMGALAGAGHFAKKVMTKPAVEPIKSTAKSIKDTIKDKVMEHPKAAAAAGAASAIGAGYGAYKYLKNRKK